MTHPNLRATNTLDQPDRVFPRAGDGAIIEDGSVVLSLPPQSWRMIRVAA